MNIKTEIEELQKELLYLESIGDPCEKIINQERIDILRTIIALRNSGYNLVTSESCDHSQFGLISKPLLYLGSYVDNDPHKSSVVYRLGCLECCDWMLENYKSQVNEKNLIGFKNPLKEEYADFYTIEKIKLISMEYHKLLNKQLSPEEIIVLLKNKFEQKSRVLVR